MAELPPDTLNEPEELDDRTEAFEFGERDEVY